MRSLERLALVGALAAAVTISGTLNARLKDLAQQRDIYQSRAANWEQDARRPELVRRLLQLDEAQAERPAQHGEVQPLLLADCDLHQ
jgi:hypothetical protein